MNKTTAYILAAAAGIAAGYFIYRYYNPARPSVRERPTTRAGPTSIPRGNPHESPQSIALERAMRSSPRSPPFGTNDWQSQWDGFVTS